MKAASCGWGGKLHILSGNSIKHVGSKFTATYQSTIVNNWYAGNGNPATNPVYHYWGGITSRHPGGYLNHKPGVFYFGQFYTSFHNISDGLEYNYMVRYDGSGMFVNSGQAAFRNNKALNGRGWEMLTPSGSAGIRSYEMGYIVHNGILFACGNFHYLTSPSVMRQQGWDLYVGAWPVPTGTVAEYKKNRQYFVMAIDKKDRTSKEHRLATMPYVKRPLARNYDDTVCNDLLSWEDDILMATSCDIVRFPGGSGKAVWIKDRRGVESSHCFEVFPRSGFWPSTGEPVYDPLTNKSDILLLSGSGTLFQIPLASGANYHPSGLIPIFDLASEFFTDYNTDEINRRTGNTMQRLTSDYLQPIRTCYLKNFSRRLHAFFPTAQSGYKYLRCDGDPRDIFSWDDYTADLPEVFKSNDGNIYGYHDTYRNELYLMHVTCGEMGIYGTAGGQLKPFGTMTIARMNPEFQWEQIFHGTGGDAPCGLIPYDPYGVYVQAPSGSQTLEILTSTDYALINYRIYSPYKRTVDVTIEYSIDAGVTWHTCRRFRSYATGALMGNGLTGLTATFYGNTYSFYWDYVSDVGMNSGKGARIRITPKLVR